MLFGRCGWIQSFSAFIESSGSNHAGSNSYSTSISSSACSAMDSDVATTQVTLSPTYRTFSTASAVSSCPTGRIPYLLGASGPVTTHTTPSRASARDVLTFLIRACGYGECRILPISIPGRDRSSVYLPWPVVLPAESTSATDLPMMEKSDILLFLMLTRLLIPGEFRCNRRLDRLIHLRIPGAAAEIATQRVAYVFFTRLGIFIEQRFHRDHETRSAIAALCSAPIAIGFLDGGERTVLCNAFYRGDLRSAILICGSTHGLHGAAQRRRSVHQDGTGPAGRIIASTLGAGQLQLLPQNVQQQGVRLRRQFVAAAVHAKLDEFFFHANAALST